MTRNQLSLGVIGRSRKEHERRLPIHPSHVPFIDGDLRSRIFLECGYGERFGVADEQLAPSVAGLLPRHELIVQCEVILMFKPTPQDFLDLRAGQVLWGCPHFVQDEMLTQLAIDRRLTVLAIEGMRHWSTNGSFSLFVFHRVCELAGFCSVQHALECVGKTGGYGRRLRAAVIGFGSTGRGAVTALNACGVHDVTIITRRPCTAVAAPPNSARMVHLAVNPADPTAGQAITERGPMRLADFLAEHDIIVNCVLQDTDSPQTFLTHDDVTLLTPDTLIIDVSCDRGMGFAWAQPTSFTEPVRTLGNNVRYYAVDHSPSLLWDSATWEISQALLPYLRSVLTGPNAWDTDETLRRAIDIRDGVVQNPRILSFQHRSHDYPHALLLNTEGSLPQDRRLGRLGGVADTPG